MAHKTSVTGRPTSSIQDYVQYLAFDMEEGGGPNAPKPCLDIPSEQCTGEIGVICMQIKGIEDKGKEEKYGGNQTNKIPRCGKLPDSYSQGGVKIRIYALRAWRKKSYSWTTIPKNKGY
ncbi:hypothetical protein BEH_26045 (plasmid) [Priestia filamentosa]|uniref:Uncharacterized protein n=1 Tax=Priestia filamentosa TaxID=1402861 RepID=A0A2S1M0D1_9BACI|nr:hypothetical protein [Priestia filamentosa]AWG44821.1 hypothetical protein BEH_26045 [Priestia filamentosa]